jgi:hypothetical protein
MREGEAKAIGKWDANYAVAMFGTLMKLGPENLLAAGEAASYDAMLTVLMTGSLAQSPQTLGDLADDLVFTPVNPCRIVDTRNIGSPIVAGTVRDFDMDNPFGFAFQGGFNGPCGIPADIAQAVAMTIAATDPVGPGFFTAWRFLSTPPTASTVNYATGETIANSTIVPTFPGGGPDFSVFAGTSTAHLIVDVIGYFAAPVATALDCNTQISAPQSIPNGGTVNIASPACPAGFTVTGGGQSTSAFFPLVSDSKVTGNGWDCQGSNNSGFTISVSCQARCCRVPGR